MRRFLILTYGVLSYALGMAALTWLCLFMIDFAVPKTIDGPATTADPGWTAIAINVSLILLFGVQHCIMARPAFKRRWTKIIPKAAERSTFVLITAAIIGLIVWQWQPMTEVIWQANATWLRTGLYALYVAGLLIAVASTFLINHFELFGLQQVWQEFRGTEPKPITFTTRGFYRVVRHPLMFGFLISFWAVPTMTMGHLVFSATFTTFVLIATRIEERDLVAAHPIDYPVYQFTTPMLVPMPSGRRSTGKLARS